MRLYNLSPEMQAGLALLAVFVVLRLMVLVGQQLERPSAPPPAAADATDEPLRPPSWFATPHERLLYDLEINRTSTELVQSQVRRTAATADLVRASQALETAIAEATPAADVPSATAEPVLTRTDIEHLVAALPDLSPDTRSRLLALVAAAFEETRR